MWNQVKLPDNVLSKFIGNPLESWFFRTCSIHRYIREENCLILRTVLFYERTESCYGNAVDLLTGTCSKPKRFIQTRIRKLPLLQSGQFRSQIGAHIRSLQTLGVNIKESGHIFTALILCKLPALIQVNISCTSNSVAWSCRQSCCAWRR